MKKKLAIIAYDLNPSLGSEAGKAYLWAKQYQENFDVTIFTQKKHCMQLEDTIEDSTITQYIETSNSLHSILKKLGLYNFSNLIFSYKVKNLIKKNKLKFNLLHIITPSGIHSFNTLYTLKIPYIIGPLGGGLQTPKAFQNQLKAKGFIKSVIREIYYDIIVLFPFWRKYYNGANLILSGTPYTAARLPSLAQKKIDIFFDTAVDTSIKIPSKTNYPQKKLIILFVGRLVEIKGANLLIEAIFRLPETIKKKITVQIAGDGPECNNLKNIVSNKKLGNIISFEGHLKRQDIFSLLSKADIFCLPTWREHGGLSILEAMFFSLPVITSDYGGPSYSVTSETGIKIPISSYDGYIEELSDSIEKLILDSDLRKKLGYAGRLRVCQNFTNRNISDVINTKIIKYAL